MTPRSEDGEPRIELGSATCKLGWRPSSFFALSCADPPPPSHPHVEPAPAATTTLDIRDDSADFVAFYTFAKSEESAARAARFERDVEPRFPAYWKYVRAGAKRNGSTFEQRLNRQVERFPEIEDEYRRVAPTLRTTLDGSLGRFRERFPDFAPVVRIRILHGMGRMDGGTRVLEGQYYLLFGADQIARIHRGGDLGPLFAHELFHVYYAQRHGLDGRNGSLVESEVEEATERNDPLYAALWDEGLAVYASEVLSPGATPSSMLLDVPAGLVPACEKNRSYLIDELRQQLDARDPKTYADWFYDEGKDPRRPGRAGYYFGYLVAKSLASRRTMDDLIALEGAPLRREIDATLATLKMQ